MSINIDPESLKALAEDVDLKFAKTIKDLATKNAELVKKLAAENAALEKQIADIKNTPQLKLMDIVSYGSINATGGYNPVSVTLSHSLGSTPSKTMVSMSIHDVGYSAYVYVSSVSSTTVTVTVPAGYAIGNVFVLLMK